MPTKGSDLFETGSNYDYTQQRRWVGQDASLIKWSMKSDTTFDGESKDPD
ncbi:MAG: hypothetical protein ACXVBX_16565 [Flavisolibacter sp.]